VRDAQANLQTRELNSGKGFAGAGNILAISQKSRDNRSRDDGPRAIKISGCSTKTESQTPKQRLPLGTFLRAVLISVPVDQGA